MDCLGFCIIALVIITKVDKPHLRASFLTIAAALFANFYLNTVLYNVVASYNGQIKAADYLNRPAFDHYHVYSLKPENNILQFYCGKPMELVTLNTFRQFDAPPNSVFYANHKSMDTLRMQHADFKVLKAFENYPQEAILPKFINKASRSTVLDSVYLIIK